MKRKPIRTPEIFGQSKSRVRTLLSWIDNGFQDNARVLIREIWRHAFATGLKGARLEYAETKKENDVLRDEIDRLKKQLHEYSRSMIDCADNAIGYCAEAKRLQKILLGRINREETYKAVLEAVKEEFDDWRKDDGSYFSQSTYDMVDNCFKNNV